MGDLDVTGQVSNNTYDYRMPAHDVIVSATFKANSYTVSFDKNAEDATGTMQPQGFTYDENAKALNVNTYTRTGYDFAGWNTVAAPTDENPGTSYTDVQSVQNLTAENNVTVTLYAQWTPHNYAVKFNDNGATGGTMSDQDFVYGTAQNLTTNGFVRAFTVTYNYNGATGGNSEASGAANATFNGWATSADGAKVYDDEASVSNLTEVNNGTFNLYAKWTDNGSVTLPTPTRTGYAFGGWYGDEALSENKRIGDGGASYMPTESCTIYAKWTANSYTVVFDKNADDAAGTMQPQGFTYDEDAKALTDNTYTRTGYDFAGWNTVAAPTDENPGTSYTDEQSVQNLTAENNVTVTLYAQWTPHNYNITIAGTSNGTVTAKVGETENVTTAHYNDTVTLTVAPAAGFALVDNSVTVTYSDGNGQAQTVAPTQDENDPAKYAFTMPAYDVTVSAAFKRIYTVTIAEGIEHGTVTADKTSVAEDAEDKTVTLTVEPAEGYALDTLTVMQGEAPVTVTNNQFTMPAGDVTVSATFVRVYTVSVSKNALITQTFTVDGQAVTPIDGENNNMTLQIPAGAEVSITATPVNSSEHRIEAIYIRNEDTHDHFGTVTDGENGARTGSFTMVEAEVYVHVNVVETGWQVETGVPVYNGEDVIFKVTATPHHGEAGTPITLTVEKAGDVTLDSMAYAYYDKEADEEIITTLIPDADGNYTFTMPDSWARVEPKYYLTRAHKIINQLGDGPSVYLVFQRDEYYECEVETTTANAGDTVRVYPNGATLQDFKVNGTEVAASGYAWDPYYEFTMPDGNATLKGSVTYRLQTYGFAHGTVTVQVGDEVTDLSTVQSLSVPVGAQVIVTATPDASYKLYRLSYRMDGQYGPGSDEKGGVEIQSGVPFTMPGGNIRIDVEFSTPWNKLRNQIDNARDGDTITLTEDAIAPAGEGYLSIRDKAITIDLNGHTIDRNLTQPTDYGCVISVDSSAALTLLDSAVGGKITGGNNNYNGGGIAVSGTLNLQGGKITGNSANYGGGVAVINSRAVFNLTGGEISGNANTSAESSAGVYYTSGAMNVSGSPVVTDAVYVDWNCKLHVAGALTNATPLPVIIYDGVSVPFTDGLPNNGNAANFKSASDDYRVRVNADGEAELYAPTFYTVTCSSCENGSLTVFGDKTSFAEGDTVTLTVSPDSGYALDTLTVKQGETDVIVENNQFTMPAGDVTVAAVFAPDPAHFSQDGDTYTIHTATGWEIFCDCLQDNDTYDRFIGKTVKLDADISVTEMAGGSQHDFMGTFDGQGHTLTVNYGSAGTPIAEDKAAPFRNVENGCVIENLHTAGTIYSSKKYAGGIVGTQYGGVTIRNCRSSVTIKSSTSGDGTHGGLVGQNGSGSGSIITIEGCVFDGKILSVGDEGTTSCSGFVGYKKTTVTITDSLYAPAALESGETEVSISNSATFIRNGSAGNNCYYTRTLGDEQGKAAHTITAGDNVTISYGTATNTYDVSGITAYGTGLAYGGKFYAGEGDEVSLTLDNTAPDGYTFKGYTASAGTLADGTLTMPGGDVTVSATFTLIPATAPTIATQPQNLSLDYGYTTGNTLSVAVNDIDGHTLSYQWYSCGDAQKTNPQAIDNATSESYTIPTGQSAGTTGYYYCVVTAEREDNSQTATTASSVATVTINPKSVATPTAASGLEWTGGELTGVAKGDGYAVENGTATAVGNYTATATLESTNYKWSDGTTEDKTISWSIGKADGPAAPTGLNGVAPTTANGSDGKITGVNTTMEYSTASDFSSKTACTGTEITGLAAGTYYVRIATTETQEAGTAAEVNVPAYVAPTYNVTITAGANMTKTTDSGAASQTVTAGNAMTSVVYTANEGYYFPEGYSINAVNSVTVTRNGWTQITVSGTPTAAASITLTDATTKTKETTPSASFLASDTNAGTLSGLVNGGQYAVTGAASATFTASGTTQALTGVSAGTLSIVKKGNGTTTTDSDAQEIAVTKATAPTTAEAVGCTSAENNDGKLTGVTAEMQHRKSDAETWTNGTGEDITGLVPGNYYVRVKASGTALASDNQMLTILAYTAPDQVAAPTFSPVAGSYNEAQNVTITCATEGATIYFTTDGTDPSTSSTVYSQAVSVSATTTIKAMAVKDGMTNSAVTSATYIIGAGTHIVIRGITGSFNDKIKLNFYFDVPNGVTLPEGSYITLNGGEKNTTIKIAFSGKSPENNGFYKFSIPLAAKEASDTITARAYDGNNQPIAILTAKGVDYTESGYQFSLMQYFEWLAKEGPQEERAIGAAAKDYCTAAQIYFNYHVADGMAVSSTVENVSDAELSNYKSRKAGELGTVQPLGITAMIEADNALRVYLTGDLEGEHTYKIDTDSTSLKTRSKDGAKYLSLDQGVFSNHLQDEHTYYIDGYEYTASVLTFAYACLLDTGNTKAQNLGKAMYLYNQAAVARWPEHN